MLASCVTFLAVLGVLVVLISNAGTTGFFTKNPPTGERAMGMIVPFAALVVASLVLVLASVLAAVGAGKSAIGLIRDTPGASGVVLVVLTLGVSIAAFLALAMWSEPLLVGPGLRGVKPLIGWTAGLLGPVVLGAVLIVGAWMPASVMNESASVKAAARWACWVLVALAAGGYGVGGLILGRPVIARVLATRAALARESPAEREARERFRHTPIEELLSEELDGLASDAPLSSVVRCFVGSPKKLTDRAREMLVQRALCVPEVDRQLVEMMGATPYLYRWGGAEMVRHAAPNYVEAHRREWATAVATGIDATAEAMMMRPAWLSETFDLNPEPLELVRSLLAAAERFEGSDEYVEISEAIGRMAAATNELTRNKERESLAKALKSAGFAVPVEGSRP